MCGIFGCIGGRHDPAAIAEAVRRLTHRGPDDQGVERLHSRQGDVWLGFRRLAILDLSSRGHQPMTDARRELWITFNGEIYNYRDLRRDLEARGHRFVSDTDTEVILYAYREWGLGAVQRFIGMFAFALWDTRTEDLILCRDRLGIKPLYYRWTPHGLAYASEPKALLALPGVERRLDKTAVATFFTFLWVPGGDTLLGGIHKLEPGCLAVYREGRLDIRSYWDVPVGPQEQVGEAEAVNRLEELLADAVRLRLISDVPLGAFLSGGVDSSLIVALMQRAGVRDLMTQTVGVGAGDAEHEIEPVDTPYARMVRDHLGGLDYHEITLHPDVAALLPRMVWHLDDLVADPAAISTYLICRAAKERATVMLSGMGAEELLAGYRRHRAVLLAERYRAMPRVLRRHVVERLVEALPASRPGPLMTFARHAKKFMRSAALDTDDRYLGYLSYYTPVELGHLLKEPPAADAVFTVHRRMLERANGVDSVQRMTYLDLKTFLPNLNLAYTDKASMAASVEVRVPILDHRVVELVARLPTELKIRGSEQKYVLKRVAARHLPPKVVGRRKTGFSAPVRSWVSHALRPMIAELLSPERLRRRGVLDERAVWRVLDDQWSGREDNALRVWAFLSFELWGTTFLDGSGDGPISG
jgi:asparagine synthase (glutamine-hydrolysing)